MTALNRCTVTESLWKRKAGCRSSLVLTEILRPSSRRKSKADSLIGPSVSTAIGWNYENEAGMSAYLASFLVAAASAADAASAEEAGR